MKVAVVNTLVHEPMIVINNKKYDYCHCGREQETLSMWASYYSYMYNGSFLLTFSTKYQHKKKRKKNNTRTRTVIIILIITP